MEQQAQPPEHGATSLPDPRLERRRARSVEQVDGDDSGNQRRERQVFAVDPERCGVHDEIRVDLGDVVDAHHAQGRAGALQGGAQVPGARRLPDGHRELRESATGERERARASPATRTEEQRRSSRRVEPRVLAEEPLETERVGVVTSRAVGPHDDRVDRSEQACVVGQVEDQLRGSGLVRHRHVRAGESERAQPLERGGELRRRDGERHVDPVHAEGDERRVVDHGREAVLDRPADHPDLPGRPPDPAGAVGQVTHRT